MKKLLLIFILTSFSFALWASDGLVDLGIKKNSDVYKKQKFESAVHDHLKEKLASFIKKHDLEISVEATIGEKQKSTEAKYKSVKLGLFGTVAAVRAPSGSAKSQQFIDRVKRLEINIFTNAKLSEAKSKEIANFAKKQVTFLKPSIVKSKVRWIEPEPMSMYSLVKDFQVGLAGLFIAFIIFIGFRYMAQQLTKGMGLLGGHNFSLTGSPVDVLPGRFDQPVALPQVLNPIRVLSEDHFFKMPLEAMQAVMGFAPFHYLQEIYTLVSPKHRRLFWSCLPLEFQQVSEDKLIKQACVIDDVENSEAWLYLSKEIHAYIQRNPDLIERINPDLRFYFKQDKEGVRAKIS